MNDVKKRDQYWDLLKGMAIVLMLIGHSIQCGNGYEYYIERDFFDNTTFKLIYGFHMPLFMFISGYFFYLSIQKRTLYEYLKKNILQIFIPIVSFGSITFIIDNITRFTDFTIIAALKSYIVNILSTLWFLWAILLSSTLLSILNKCKLDSWYVNLGIIVILYSIPDVYFIIAGFKYLYPYYFLAYKYHQYNVLKEIGLQYNLIIGIIATIVYVMLMIFCYTEHTYIYTSYTYIFQQGMIGFHLYNDLLRTLVGVLGIIGVLGISRYLYQSYPYNSTFIRKLLTILGVNSMGIYCFQDLIMKRIPMIISDDYYLSELLVFTVVLLFSYFATYISQRIRPVRVLFLGGR